MCKEYGNVETDFKRMLDYIADKLLVRNCRHFFFLSNDRNIQGVPGGKDLTSGECSLGHTIPI